MTYKPGIQALKNVTFKIDDGEFVFIIGMSGSGKSTLIKLLTCEEKPTTGKVFIDNFEISHLKRNLIPFLRRNIGMVFQDFRLIQTRSVYQNVAFAMEIVGARNNLIRRRVPMVLSTVGLRDKADMLPGQLSGGEQQRVAIARAMVNNPALILADEPTGNLDPINSESVMALLKEINDNGTTVVICTHDATMVNKLKRRVIEISEGYLVRDDILGEYNLSPEKIKKKKHHKADTAKAERKARAAAFHDQDESPFVRNINIKFDELGFGLSDEVLDEPAIEPAEAGAADPLQAQDTQDILFGMSALAEPATVADEPIVELLSGSSVECKDDAAEIPTVNAGQAVEPDAGSTDDEQEAIRIAVEYYMRKAKKIHDETISGNGKKEFFVFNTEDTQIGNETESQAAMQADFSKLIKPKRIDTDLPPGVKK